MHQNMGGFRKWDILKPQWVYQNDLTSWMIWGYVPPILGNHHITGDGMDGALYFYLVIVPLLMIPWIHSQTAEMTKSMPKYMKMYKGWPFVLQWINQNGGGVACHGMHNQQYDRVYLGCGFASWVSLWLWLPRLAVHMTWSALPSNAIPQDRLCKETPRASFSDLSRCPGYREM